MVFEFTQWDDSHATAIQVCETVSSILSLSAIALMTWKIRTDSIKSKLILTNQLLQMLFSINFVLLLFFLIGLSAQKDSKFCIFQAVMIQWFGSAELLWVTAMTYHLYGWIVLKKNPDTIIKGLKYDIAVIITITGIVALSLLGYDVYGPSETWCWIKPSRPLCRFIVYYAVEIVAIVGILFMVGYSTLFLKGSVVIGGSPSDLVSLQLSENRIRQKLTSYVIVFIFVWFFGLLDGFVTLLNQKPIFTTSLLQAIILPLQGFLLSLFFGNLVKNCERFFKKAVEDDASSGGKLKVRDSQMTTEIIESSHKHNKYVSRFPNGEKDLKSFSTFISTFNLGEASCEAVKASMVDWILPGHDIYVLGFQECLDVQGARKIVLDAIGGSNEYSMFTAEIGSGNTKLGYHGFIAITVYIRNKDLIEGNVRPCLAANPTLATGTNLIVTTGSNKGGVGVPLQIHDTTIGFIVTHLPSDSKGVSKLSKRNGSAHKILQELNLSPETVGFDCHFQLDHMVFMGDLNYRMDTTNVGGGVSTLTGVSVACIVEKHTIDEDPAWIKRRYNLLRAPSDPLFPSLADRQLYLSARNAAKGAWQSVLRADELHMIMEDGDAFLGFSETMPCFPPTYKRKTGEDSACGDYCDPILMIKGFSNTGEIEENIVQFKDIKPTALAPAASQTSEDGYNSASSEGTEERKGSKKRERRTNVSRQVEPPPTTDDRESLGRVEVNPYRLNPDAALSGSSKPVRKPVSAKEAKKIRPPSYTDRILLYSQEDRKSQAHILAYDFCDSMVVSDHKPVSMVLSLHVNPRIKFHDNTIDLNLMSASSYQGADRRHHVPTLALGYQRVKENVSSSLFEITVVDLNVKFNNSLGLDLADLLTDEDIDDDIADDISEQSENSTDLEASWGPDALDDGVEKRTWSQKVKEQELSKQESVKSGIAVKAKELAKPLKDEKKKAKNDKNVQNVTIVCPLPSKDPLVIYKKMNDLAEAFNVNETSILQRYNEISKEMVQSSSTTTVNVNAQEYTSNPMATSLVGDNSSNTSSNNNSDSGSNVEKEDILLDRSFFSRPATVFPWKEQNILTNAQRRKTILNNDIPESRTCSMRFCAAMSTELGGNILLKFTNAAEIDLGECSVCISHILPTNQVTIMKSEFPVVSISSGGQKRGDCSLTVLVRLLSDTNINSNTNI